MSSGDIEHGPAKADRTSYLSAAHTRQILSAIQSILICVDAEGKVIYWNNRAGKVFGIRAQEILGRKFEDFPIDWDLDDLKKQMETCLKENRQVRLDDFKYNQADKIPKILGIVLSPLMDESEEITGCLLVGQDITSRKLMERQLAQAQKMESIGMLAAGIAHEINTPTQYVGYNLEYVAKNFTQLAGLVEEYRTFLKGIGREDPFFDEAGRILALEEENRLERILEQIPRALGQSLEGIERVKQIVLAMKDYSHPGGQGAEVIDLKKAIESTVTVARNEWKNAADVSMDFDPELESLECYPSEFNQAILNVVVNAAQAIGTAANDGGGKKGLIQISTRRDGNWAEIRIRDTGSGIPPEVQPRIFDPFFTTKEIGKGSGQGLYITHQVIVEKHHGSIQLETEPGKGTTFIIPLPLRQE